MNPFFESSVESSDSSAFLELPSTAYLNRSSFGVVDSNHSLCQQPTKSQEPGYGVPQSSSFNAPAVSSQSNFVSSQVNLHGPSLSSIPPDPHRNRSSSSLSLSSLFSEASRSSLNPSEPHIEQSDSSPSSSTAYIRASPRHSTASASTSFFGGSGSGVVSSFFHPTHLLRSGVSRAYLPHPLAQPYQLFPKHPFVLPSGVTRNFFQSPFPPTRYNNKETSGTPSLDLILNNIVAVCSVRCHLDLHHIVMRSVNVVFRRDRCVLIMKLRNPRVTCRIWSSGKITCTGAACEEDAKIGCRRVARLLSKLGYNVQFSKYRVVNILATCVLPYAIKLVKFAEENIKEVDYEPEIHPGASMRFPDLKVNLRIFSTGSITITAPKVPSIEEGIQRAYKLVYKYRNEEEEKLAFTPIKSFKQAMSIVPLLSQTQSKNRKMVPRGPFHSKYKQNIHREHFMDQALHQVRTVVQADDYLLHDVYDSDSDFSD